MQSRLLERRYRRFAATLIMTFVVLIGLLVVWQYRDQRHVLIETLAEELHAQRLAIDALLASRSGPKLLDASFAADPLRRVLDGLVQGASGLGDTYLLDANGAVVAGHEPNVSVALTSASDGSALGQAPVENQLVLNEAVGQVPWTLTRVVSESEIRAKLMPRFVPYGGMLAGLLAIFAATHLFLRHNYVRPALLMARQIQAESLDAAPPTARVPRPWQPCLDAVTEAFATRRRYQAQLQESEARFPRRRRQHSRRTRDL